MYLWKMVIGGNERTTFKFTEHTPEKEKGNITGYFKTDKSYSKDDLTIKPVVEATIKVCKALNLDLKERHVVIERGFDKLIFMYWCGVFDARLKDGLVVVRTENGWCFTREQFNAIFDFIDIVKESNWFF